MTKETTFEVACVQAGTDVGRLREGGLDPGLLEHLHHDRPAVREVRQADDIALDAIAAGVGPVAFAILGVTGAVSRASASAGS